MLDITKIVFILAVSVMQALGAKYCPYGGFLSAVKSPMITTFNQTLAEPSDYLDRMECIWKLTASEKTGHIVRLNFDSFHLKNTTSGGGEGDCISIYDGDDIKANLVEELCDRLPPAASYNSTHSNMAVVFRQGNRGGQRWFSLNYTMATAPDSSRASFWTSIFGRILSFAILVLIFSFFSATVKCMKNTRGPKGCLGDLCHFLCSCAAKSSSRVSDCCHRAFKTRPRSPPGSGSRSRTHPEGTTTMGGGGAPYDDRSLTNTSDIGGGGPDFSRLSSGGQGRRSYLDDSVSDASTTELGSMAALPPDYETAMASGPVNIIPLTPLPSPGGGGGGGGGGIMLTSLPPAPPYRESSDTPLPPPPVDGAAPPAYDLPEPPSYDSLFISVASRNDSTTTST